MNFTNPWDDTYPPDKSARANQLGVYLRALKTDTQQRLAAISSTTGIGPGNFSQDSQPAQWNGVLFFNPVFFSPGQLNVLQFRNPGFFPVSIMGQRVFGGPMNQPISGTVARTYVTSFTVPGGTIPSPPTTARWRITMTMDAKSQINPGAVDITVTDNVTTTTLGYGFVNVGVTTGTSGLGYIWGGWETAGDQLWIGANPGGNPAIESGLRPFGILQLISGPSAGAPFYSVVRTTYDTTRDLIFTLYATPGGPADIYTFHLFGMEVL